MPMRPTFVQKGGPVSNFATIALSAHLHGSFRNDVCVFRIAPFMDHKPTLPMHMQAFRSISAS